MASQEQMRQQLMMRAREQQFQQMLAARRQQEAAAAAAQQQNSGLQQQMQPQSMAMGSTYDDLPLVEPNDLEFLSGQNPLHLSSFQSACRQGPVSAVQAIVTAGSRTPAFLHYGLTVALGAGNAETARYLLDSGAPIVRNTPANVLNAPPEQQIPLFELLTQHGWTTNTPAHYGAVLLPRVATNVPVLRWFLAHGANPNLGAQRDNRDRNGGPDTDSCAALEHAAAKGTVEAVELLLAAGAVIQNGVPLHYAAGACPPGTNPHSARVTPSSEFDAGRIPVMAVLVENGADVNQRVESRHVNPQYAIVHAVMAGAVERVRWLLSKGANPNAKGWYGSAADYVQKPNLASDEMKRVIEEGIAAKKWVENTEQED